MNWVTAVAVSVLVSTVGFGGVASAQEAAPTSHVLGSAEAQSDAVLVLESRFKKKFLLAPFRKVRCKRRTTPLSFSCDFLFVTTGRHDAFPGKLKIRVEDPYDEPFTRVFFYGGTATRFDGPCLIRTGQRAGCAKRKYKI
jgi:hypothetical protein